jgi:hypothetical protein
MLRLFMSAGHENVCVSRENWLGGDGQSFSQLRRTDQALLRLQQLLRAQACGADVQLPWGRPGALLPHCGLRKPAPLCCLLLPACWLIPRLDATTKCQLVKRQCDGPMVPTRGSSREQKGLRRGVLCECLIRFKVQSGCRNTSPFVWLGISRLEEPFITPSSTGSAIVMASGEHCMC